MREFTLSTSFHLAKGITPFFMNLILQMHARQRSMYGVIVVDAGRSRSTNLGRDAYILILALDIIIIICSSINYPTVNFLPTVCYFLREATSFIYGPQVYSLSYLFSDLFFQKTKNTLVHFFFIILFCDFAKSISQIHTI